MKTATGELIPAPTKALQTLIGRANAEYKKVMDGRRATEVAKTYTLKHAILCGKALGKVKEKAGHGGWAALFEGPNPRFSAPENLGFEGGQRQAGLFIKIAIYPQQAAAAMLADPGERFNLDRTYAALASANPETEQQLNHRAKGTGQNEWYTPAQYIEAAREVLGVIDLDPASSAEANETVDAERFLTIDDDGLSHEWHGALWMNPPYSQPAIMDFCTKLVAEYEEGRTTAAIALTHNYTDTAWFHRLASSCLSVCFTRGRIAFEGLNGEKASPTQGQAFFYFGDDTARFELIFRQFGLCFRPTH